MAFVLGELEGVRFECVHPEMLEWGAIGLGRTVVYPQFDSCVLFVRQPISGLALVRFSFDYP